jgi:hypothetical protein
MFLNLHLIDWRLLGAGLIFFYARLRTFVGTRLCWSWALGLSLGPLIRRFNPPRGLYDSFRVPGSLAGSINYWLAQQFAQDGGRKCVGAVEKRSRVNAPMASWRSVRPPTQAPMGVGVSARIQRSPLGQLASFRVHKQVALMPLADLRDRLPRAIQSDALVNQNDPRNPVGFHQKPKEDMLAGDHLRLQILCGL